MDLALHGIQKQVALAERVWFRTGGSAEYFAAPTTTNDAREVVAWARRHAHPITILGEGANILIADQGIAGLVIRPMLREVYIEYMQQDNTIAHVTAGSGLSLGELIQYCLNHELLGLEEFSGIPGTIGGAVYINAHFFQFLISHFLVQATLLDLTTLEVITVPASWFAFGYNSSRLQQQAHLLLDATFRVQRGTTWQAAYAQGRHDEMKRYRAQRYPAARTCGSFFRNFHEQEVTITSNGKKMTYIAFYLDKLGVKGTLFYGKALVSHQHANMLLTREGATSHDVVELARELQVRVHQAFNIIPEPECQLLGFATYPLIQAI